MYPMSFRGEQQKLPPARIFFRCRHGALSQIADRRAGDAGAKLAKSSN
jgi:hypothetical protein